MKSDAVYFELNMWEPGTFYPNESPFTDWIALRGNKGLLLDDINFVKDNKLCVVVTIIDQSVNYCISASRDWVEQQCPNLLTKHTKFLRHPSKDGNVYGQWGTEFMLYTPDHIGVIEYEA